MCTSTASHRHRYSLSRTQRLPKLENARGCPDQGLICGICVMTGYSYLCEVGQSYGGEALDISLAASHAAYKCTAISTALLLKCVTERSEDSGGMPALCGLLLRW